jgi:hypothetical protein
VNDNGKMPVGVAAHAFIKPQVKRRTETRQLRKEERVSAEVEYGRPPAPCEAAQGISIHEKGGDVRQEKRPITSSV